MFDYVSYLIVLLINNLKLGMQNKSIQLLEGQFHCLRVKNPGAAYQGDSGLLIYFLVSKTIDK